MYYGPLDSAISISLKKAKRLYVAGLNSNKLGPKASELKVKVDSIMSLCASDKEKMSKGQLIDLSRKVINLLSECAGILKSCSIVEKDNVFEAEIKLIGATAIRIK